MSVLSASKDAVATTAGQPPKPEKSYPSQISTYIPGDALATYIALLGLVSPKDTNAKWILYGVGLALCAIIPVLNWAVASPKPPFGKQYWVILIALITFTTYAMALPGSVFLTIWKSAALIGAGVAIVLAPLLPKVATLLNINPATANN